MVGFGALYSAVSVTRMLVPIDANFNVGMMLNKLSYQELKNRIGKSKMTIINNINITFFFTIFILSFYFYYNGEKYSDNLPKGYLEGGDSAVIIFSK